jgi:copper ion binding protein
MSSTATFTVSGMTCEHCVASVSDEILEIAGVTVVDVDLPTGRLTVTSDQPVSEDQVASAVDEAGYRLS